ncbi:MAG TPA: CAP domain-containing protein [Pantanalinema sp.]
MRLFNQVAVGGLLLVTGCASVPLGMIPEAMTPSITTNPANLGGGSGGVEAGRPTPGRTPAPVVTPIPQPGNTPAPIATPAPVATPVAPASDLAGAEGIVFQQTNAERAKVGARALVSDPTLNALARSRSEDMVKRNYFDHVTPDGKKVFDMLKEMGFSYTTAGENIAYNSYPISQSPQQVMTAWMNSSGHKANILNTRYGRIGVGTYKRSSDGAIFYTQVFTN